MDITQRKVALCMQLTVLVTGSLFTGTLVYMLYQEQQHSIMQEFSKEYLLRVDSFKETVMNNLSSLHSLAVLFDVKPQASKAEFRHVSSRILATKAGIQALQWVPRVTQHARQEFEQKNQQNYAQFAITERLQGQMQAAQIRKQYYPVQYIEPLFGNEAALGFDLFSSQTRRDIIQTSRDLALPLVTASITLVQDPHKQKAFIALRPIYEHLSLTVADKRDNIRGFVIGVFKLNALVAHSKLGKNEGDIEFVIEDVTNAEQPQTLYRNRLQTQGQMQSWLDVWGRNWVISASPSHRFVQSRISAIPVLVLFIGMVMTFLMFFYVRLLYRRQIAIQHAVRIKTKELDKANARLLALTQIDGLTEVSNRRHFDMQLQKEWRRAVRIGSPISLVVIDIDFFKEYNDYYGHVAGDRCLCLVANALAQLAQRACDVFARIGGEEFIFILPDTEQLDGFCEKCLAAVAALEISHERSSVSQYVTVSVGACAIRPDSNDERSHLLDMADQAMYRAKDAGRNTYAVKGATQKAISTECARQVG
ncbi:diguanylate cyclase [Pseudoalteromonas luteoviolacea]|uniref:CHASE domain-containing protein n=1 Tax=Pseudoalteromonas luteoviolacea TaxID=43657 RepID=UPI001B398617|nr:diguanylate cyclase [Pseudoalteromonas luteoviolacea]MBQ4813939.1 diguanylate cyclase [Pseudoalteromonas luteoviolacea]